MKNKINTIFFIFLLFFLICAVSAADSENEIIESTVQPDPNQDIYKISNIDEDKTGIAFDGKLSKANAESTEKLSVESNNTDNLQIINENEKLEKTEGLNPAKLKLKASNVNMYYKDGSKFTATFMYGTKYIANAKILIKINGKTYEKTTDKKGSASITLNLNSGTYSITTKLKDDTYQVTPIKNTVKIKSTIKASDFKKIYKNSSPYTATFYDKKGALLKNTAIKFKLNSKTYSIKTNKKGIGSLNINLKPGKYTISPINLKTTESISKTVTITSLITGNKDLTKYYKNSKEYSVKIIDSNGKAVKGKQVSFKMNGATYKKTTDKNGYAKINVNLNPGSYTIKAYYGDCSVSNKITIKTLINSNDLTMNESDGSKFSVKVLNSNGKAAPNQKVTFTVNGKTYTKTSDKNGKASLSIGLKTGKYTITTKYNNLKASNKIIVKSPIVYTKFMHTVKIPSYVNVTAPLVVENSIYTIKKGVNGIVKLPKVELFTIKVNGKSYSFTTSHINGIDAVNMIDKKSYFIPFDGSGLKSDLNKNNLKGNGIIITKIVNYTQIDYLSNSSTNTDLFGFYASKSIDHSETFTYQQNEKVMATVSFQTQNFDELGLKYSLAARYGKTIYDFNYKSYDEITKHNTNLIRFTNTNEPVSFSYFGNSIIGPPSQENIVTKFFVNGKEESEKVERISYGLNKKYRNSIGFEVLQSYSIINKKITQEILNSWIMKNSSYLNRFGVMNLYGMHLASLETAFLADLFADEHSKEYDVTWKRSKPLTILGGINLEDTYLDILNADMGMEVSGQNQATIPLFKFGCSIHLPYFEDFALSAIAERYSNKTMNSLDSIFTSIANNNYSVCQIKDMIYLFSSNSAIVLNTSNGICSVLIKNGNNTYKGSHVHTSEDCCSVCSIPEKIIKGIKELSKTILNQKFEKVYPASVIIEKGLKLILSKQLTGAASVANSLFTIMNVVQAMGSTFKDKILDEKYWHDSMDIVTYTRPGYFQGKKVYNIPNNNGGYDYIEIKIKDDLTLDRNNAVYISQGKTKKLTKAETYNYFSEDAWTPFAMPTKYWDKSWIGG